MEELVQYIVTSIVTNPDQVSLESQDENGTLVITLHVAEEDMGVVIGKKGQTIKAIRKLLTVRAMAENIRVNLQLHDQAGRPTDQAEPTEPPSAPNSAEATLDKKASGDTETTDETNGETSTKTPEPESASETEAPEDTSNSAPSDAEAMADKKA